MIINFLVLIDLQATFVMFSFVMPNSQTTYNILYFHHQVSCSVISSLMFVP
jgi:hypothetical protein